MSDFDTQMGKGTGGFHTTPWSILLQRTEKGHTPVRLDLILQKYWRPVYHYIRRRWKLPNEDAKDLTQGFFVFVMEKGILEKADPDRGKFRSFLRTSLERYLINQYEMKNAKMRGGDKQQVPLHEGIAAEKEFAEDWAKGLVEDVLEELKEHYKGREKYLEVLKKYELEGGGTYDAIAQEMGISVWDVTNYLADARRRFRTAVETRIRAYCENEEDYQRELRELFGAP